MFDHPEPRPRVSLEDALKKVRDVKVPRSVHSHNDEIRPVPLWDALTHGFLYVEPDVIHKDGALCIGHNEDDLVPGDTLDSLYLDPLRRLLKALYPDSQPGQARGVYPNAPKESLYLVIDFKFPGQEYLDSLMNSLRPFIEEGWLSRVEDGKLIESSLTIVLTGRWEPLLDEVRAMQPRHLFVDADLLQLENDPHNFDSLLAPMASGNAKKAGFHTIGIHHEATEEMCKAVKEAHRRGMKARWWSLPEFPELLRERSWKMALHSGADILNADYLPEAVLHFDGHLAALGQRTQQDVEH